MSNENIKYEVAKAVKAVRSYRDEKWKKALNITKENFEKASAIYDTL